MRDFEIDCEINGLNPHKTHDHDGTSIRMLNLSNLRITKPLSVIYTNYLQQGVFPDDWNTKLQCTKKSKQIANY